MRIEALPVQTGWAYGIRMILVAKRRLSLTGWLLVEGPDIEGPDIGGEETPVTDRDGF